MKELPTPVTEDLFDITCPHPEMALAHIADQIESFDFTVGESIHKGVLITLPFTNKTIKGAVTINRLERIFSIEARTTGDGSMFLPVTGSWPDVRTYLANLQRAAH